MIALAKNVRYVDEPFNLKYRHSPFQYWFEYVEQSNEEHYRSYIENEITLSAKLLKWDPLLIQKRQDIKPRLRKWRDQLAGKRPLFKDPIAVLSAEWLATQWNMSPVVAVRHPAAVINSIKHQNWTHDFSQFLKQPALMSRYFNDFKDEIEDFTQNNRSIIEQSALLWKLIHHVIAAYQRTHKKWYFVKYEDLAADPVNQFREIYKYLSLEYSDAIVQKIKQYASATNNAEDPHAITRDSRNNLTKWKRELTDDEIALIKKITAPVSDQFYTESEW